MIILDALKTFSDYFWIFPYRRTNPGTKATISLENDVGKCHNWTTADGISATAVTDPEYPERAAFILLNNLLLDFREYFAADPSVY